MKGTLGVLRGLQIKQCLALHWWWWLIISDYYSPKSFVYYIVLWLVKRPDIKLLWHSLQLTRLPTYIFIFYNHKTPGTLFKWIEITNINISDFYYFRDHAGGNKGLLEKAVGLTVLGGDSRWFQRDKNLVTKLAKKILSIFTLVFIWSCCI